MVSLGQTCCYCEKEAMGVLNQFTVIGSQSLQASQYSKFNWNSRMMHILLDKSAYKIQYIMKVMFQINGDI